MDLEKIIKKFLMTKPFHNDGFEYQFIEVNQVGIGSYNIVVNVVLPNPNQSWCHCKFESDAFEIISNMGKYLDASIGYSLTILVEGVNSKVNNFVFINEDQQKEIVESLNQTMNHVEFKFDDYTVGCNISWKRTKRFVEMGDIYIYFHFFLRAYNFTLDGKHVSLKMNYIDDIGYNLNEEFRDNDSFRERLEGIIYSIVEPSIKIHDADDCYIQGLTYLQNVDGMIIDSYTHRGANIEPKMFNL